ncbi:NUDIX hydrolase [Roseibium sediminicola]|uniref:NUDIX hydrolase n=1 Tax=Roseibium sediminicola TaxID=2933272 RepID=A0ABT0GRI7_9HYPH|nr:NUDIX hydrolase [Roseibium sp. CAU 1639]MCK7612064.1 NUDIX hydrolase [Roseibium sp. CAU 1639]
MQIAALCHRMRDGRAEVLLVTSKSTRRWILPKGWPILSHRAHRTAAIEAFEEAGVVGRVHKNPFASFSSYKGGEAGLKIRTEILVFLVDVDSVAEEFPDSAERDSRWVSIEEAIKITNDSGLADVFRKLEHLYG